MSVNLQGFDASKVEPSGTFQPVPAGEYPAIIVKSEKKPTRNNDGHYIQIECQIVDGEHKGRQVTDRLNLWNKNPQAVQIAQGTLSAICRAVDVLKPKDTSELHNKPLMITVKCEKSKYVKDGVEQEGINNVIKGYKSIAVKQEPDNSGYSEPVDQAEEFAKQQETLETISNDAPWAKG